MDPNLMQFIFEIEASNMTAFPRERTAITDNEFPGRVVNNSLSSLTQTVRCTWHLLHELLVGRKNAKISNRPRTKKTIPSVSDQHSLLGLNNHKIFKGKKFSIIKCVIMEPLFQKPIIVFYPTTVRFTYDPQSLRSILMLSFFFFFSIF